jgi:hypothetical protein
MCNNLPHFTIVHVHIGAEIFHRGSKTTAVWHGLQNFKRARERVGELIWQLSCRHNPLSTASPLIRIAWRVQLSAV